MPEPLLSVSSLHGHAPATSATTVTVIVLASVAVGVAVLHFVGFSVLGRICGRSGRVFLRSLVRRAKRPTAVILPLAGLEIALGATHLSPVLRSRLLHGVGIAIILAVAFLFVRLTYVIEDLILDRHRLDTADNLRARQLHTQIQILRRITVVIVAVVAVAVVLLSFNQVRVAGASLLASAGLVGLVAGVAAKPTVANVIAGIQIALSQPIRVDDVVVVDGQQGRVEQIALTYVVLRLWDLRRLVLPIAYFVENPFENWTRSTADIVGWFYLEVDHHARVDLLREKLHEILSGSANWDGNLWNLQVSGSGTSTMQLRAVMSAPSSAASWDLQCEVREKLIAFMREHHPAALPRVRAEVASEHVDAGLAL